MGVRDLEAPSVKAQIWCDGSGTPTTPCACGAHVRIGDQDHYFAVKLPHLRTNNEAELTAILFGIEKARALGATEFTVYSDSQFAVNSLNGKFRSKEKHLHGIILFIRDALKDMKVEIAWRSRDHSAVPDALCHVVHSSPFLSYTVSPVPVHFSIPKLKSKRTRFYHEAVQEKIKRLSASS